MSYLNMVLKIIWISNIYKRFSLFSLIFNWFLDDIVKVLYKNWYGFTCVFSKILVLGGKEITIFSASNLCLRILAAVIKNESEKGRGKDEN